MNRLFTCFATLGFATVGISTAHAECTEYHGLADIRDGFEKAKDLAYFQLAPEDALGVLEETESYLYCMTELIPTSDLTALSLHKGAILLDLGQTETGEAAIGRAAGVSARITFSDPNLNQATRLQFLQARDQRFLLERASLNVKMAANGQIFALDGQPIAVGTPVKAITPGEHFFQISESGKWHGHWISIESGGMHDLTLEDGMPTVSKAGVKVSKSSSHDKSTASVSWVKPTFIGLTTGAALGASIFAMEEFLYRSGRLHDENGVQVDNYETHLTLHRVSAGAALVLGAGAIGLKVFEPKLTASRAGDGRQRDIQWVLGPSSIAINGRF